MDEKESKKLRNWKNFCFVLMACLVLTILMLSAIIPRSDQNTKQLRSITFDLGNCESAKNRCESNLKWEEEANIINSRIGAQLGQVKIDCAASIIRFGKIETSCVVNTIECQMKYQSMYTTCDKVIR